ncbi:MAG TPA: DinB family protein [Terriglobales bacterium]|nr:DinB family protein [Terriglobales bacterium]
MKRVVLTVMLLCCAMAFAQQQPPKPPAHGGEVLDRQLKLIESEFVPAAEAMPADKYDFAPTQGEFKGVRTFAKQVKHVAATNYNIAAGLLGEKPPVDLGKGEDGPENLKSKEEIVKFLKDSFAYAHKAVGTINEKNLVEMIPGPFGGKSSRMAAANIMIWHSFDHYGQMAVYLRMNSIIPPASRQQQ